MTPFQHAGRNSDPLRRHLLDSADGSLARAGPAPIRQPMGREMRPTAQVLATGKVAHFALVSSEGRSDARGTPTRSVWGEAVSPN